MSSGTLDALVGAAEEILRTAWPGGRSTLVGIGWATVELDRAAVELGALVAAGQPAWTDAPRDALLGASARVGRAGGEGLAIVLLEPDTEGRIAASLARTGEGVAVAYVRTAVRPAGAVLSRPESGPLGPARLLVGGRAWGPHLVVLEP